LASPDAAFAEELISIIALPDTPFVVSVATDGAQRNVTTQLNNNARQGAYLAGPLWPSKVHDSTFGKLHQQPVEGQVLAQPLYVHDVDIEGMGRRSLVIVATAANMVYALDANDLSVLFGADLNRDKTGSTRDALTNSARVLDKEGNNNSLVDTFCSETYPAYVGSQVLQ
jgi:hypothetical protein